MNKSKLNVRKIKCIGDCVDNGESYIDPITLQIGKNNNKNMICPTEKYLDSNKKVLGTKKCKNREQSSYENLVQFMAVPYLKLPPEQLLVIYDVEDINKLENNIEKEINEDNFYQHINRILNAWNKVNYDMLKINSNFLQKIYFKINKKYWNYKVNDDTIKKDINKYIDSWFKKKIFGDFNFNLGNDLNKYLSKKYDKTTR